LRTQVKISSGWTATTGARAGSTRWGEAGSARPNRAGPGTGVRSVGPDGRLSCGVRPGPARTNLVVGPARSRRAAPASSMTEHAATGPLE